MATKNRGFSLGLKPPERQKRRIAALRKKPVQSTYHIYASITGFLQALLFTFIARSVDF
ncbi:MAG: hypothetical protein H6Q64_2172 [Firmicutes bacterium]|nr:hypothetical protein [Bacillota bacterium]